MTIKDPDVQYPIIVLCHKEPYKSSGIENLDTNMCHVVIDY